MTPTPEPKKDGEPDRDRDEPTKLDLPFEEAVRGLLKVDPDAEPVENDPKPKRH